MTRFLDVLLDELADDPEACRRVATLLATHATNVDGLLTPRDVADRLGVSTRTVNRWARDGRLPAIRVGRGWRFEEGQLDLAPPERPAQVEPAIRRALRRSGQSPDIGTRAIMDAARKRA